jgi:hypothetical protein
MGRAAGRFASPLLGGLRRLPCNSTALAQARSEPVPGRQQAQCGYAYDGGRRVNASNSRALFAGRIRPDWGVCVRPWRLAPVPMQPFYGAFSCAPARPMKGPIIPRKAGVEGSNPSVGFFFIQAAEGGATVTRL